MNLLVKKYNKMQNILKCFKIFMLSWFGLASIAIFIGYIYCIFTWPMITIICTIIFLIGIFIEEKIRTIKIKKRLKEYDM